MHHRTYVEQVVPWSCFGNTLRTWIFAFQGEDLRPGCFFNYIRQIFMAFSIPMFLLGQLSLVYDPGTGLCCGGLLCGKENSRLRRRNTTVVSTGSSACAIDGTSIIQSAWVVTRCRNDDHHPCKQCPACIVYVVGELHLRPLNMFASARLRIVPCYS